jgi:hypothetical protein
MNYVQVAALVVALVLAWKLLMALLRRVGR